MTEEGRRTSLVKIIPNGQKYHMEMMDGSRWFVDPGDLSKIVSWTPTAEIHIVRNRKSVFSFDITNVNEERTVSAMERT